MGLYANRRWKKVAREEGAAIEWKGAIWRGATSDLSIKDLLTTLKGHGPTETLEFIRAGHCRGKISLGLTREGVKEVTVFDLEIFGEKRQGKGREALEWLKKVFDGELYAQDFGIHRQRSGPEESLPFWIEMFRQGIIAGLESEICPLSREMSELEIDLVEEGVRRILAV